MKRLNKLLLAAVLFMLGLFLIPQKIYAIEVNCSTSGPINVEEYVAPRCDGVCPTVGSSSVGEGFAYIGNVSNYVEWVDDTKYKQHSNDIHFLYTVEGGVIKFLRDTIWGGGPSNGFFTCEGTNQEAFYQVFDSSGSWGRGILATSMSCGETYTSSGYINAYAKDPSMETNMNEGPFNQCDVSGQSGIETTGTQQLVFQGTAICNSLNPIDVIVTTNLEGAGAGEVYVYCKGYGLCAWYQTLDFEENSPADWDESTDVCALEAGITSNINRDPYYVEPIEGIYEFEDQGYQIPYNPDQVYKIYEDLVAQGYQAYCSIPNLQAIASANTNTLMLEDMIGISGNAAHNESTPGNRVYVDLDDYKQFFNYIDSQTPLWRKKGVYVLKDKDSLENFWSHKNEDERIGIISLHHSPAYTVTSPEDQCREKKKIIAAVDMKCKTLQNPETCALDISYDPNSMRFWELYKVVEETGFDCSLMNTPNAELNQTQIDIKNSFMRMPYALPTAYRWAFAVYSAELREPKIASEFGFEWTDTTHKPGFDFLRFDPDREPTTNQRAVPRNEVRILAFLVPDFGTNQDNIEFTFTPPPEVYFPNKGPIMTKVHTPKYEAPMYDWHDALKISRNALQTPELQEDFDTIWRARKEEATIPDPFNNGEPFEPFAEVKEMYNPDSETTKLIECLYYDGEPVPEEFYKYACVEPLERAITTFINRRMENPQDCHQDVVEWEKNKDIYDDAGVQRSDAALFHLWNGNSVHAQAGSTYNGNPVHMLDNGFFPNDVANTIPNTDDESNGPIEDPNKQVFEFRFLSHFAFSSFYDGLDPIYRDQQPERDEDTKVKIHGYLLYPVGYELEAAEDTFLHAFLTPDQIEQFEEEFIEDERDIWFKMKGVAQDMTTKTKKYEVSNPSRSNPDRFMFVTVNECQQMYNEYVASLPPDRSPMSYEDFEWQNCMKVPEATIKSEQQVDKEPRILGARFGLITIKLQQTLRRESTPSWDYITSCLESATPTEDFLTGRCSGTPTDTGRVDPEDEPDENYMNTAVATCNGGPRIVNSIGEYELPASDISCSIDDSMDSGLGSGSCDPDDPDLDDNCAVEYIESVHSLDPSDPDKFVDASDRITCDDDFFSFVACSFNEDTAYRPSLIAHLVDDQGRFTPDGSKTACDYVQDRAAEQNVSPRLALSIWLEETGASAYSTETGGPDFGVLSAPTSRQSGSIEPQLRLFLGTINSNRNIGYPRFLLQYSGEYLYGVDPDLTWRDWSPGDPVLFCRNRGFAGRLKNFYDQLGSY